MSILIKIAFRNILTDRKRSALIMIPILFSSLLLFILNSSLNGIAIQVLRGYISLRSGHVVVIWEEHKKVSTMSPARLSGFYNNFDVEKDNLNKPAIERLNEFLKDNKKEIKYYFPTIHNDAQVYERGDLDYISMYGLTSESGNYIINSGAIKMEKGALLSDTNNGICISRIKAEMCNVDIGDTLIIEADSPYGAKNILEFPVTGIYANSADYDNGFGFISEKNAREFFDYDPEYFDIGRIYLKNPENSLEFARKLDKYLLSGSEVLRAESYEEASAIYPSFTKTFKMMCNALIFLLLIMIAFGLRATIKMNLYERMREFGTVRAIGFSRMQNYAIIFFEILFLSMISLIIAFIISGIYVIIIGNTGIYVGARSTLSNFIGGDRFFPEMFVSDILYTLIIIVIFSLFSTFNPGMKICFQKITDLLLKRQRKVYLTGILFKKIIKI